MKTHLYALKLAALRIAWGGRCVKCGLRPRKYVLEFAHLRPTAIHGRGRGLRQRYLDIVHNPGSYVLLCYPCHRWFDRTVGGFYGTQ